MDEVLNCTAFDNAARLNAINFVELLHHSVLFALCAHTFRRLRLDNCSKDRASSEHAQHKVRVCKYRKHLCDRSLFSTWDLGVDYDLGLLPTL